MRRKQQRRSQAQGQRAPRQEEDQRPRPRARRLRRLQGRQPAPPVHVRPGQDPRPPRHRQRRQQQREVARAIKNAREMALLPYTNRVTTQRGRAPIAVIAVIAATVAIAVTVGIAVTVALARGDRSLRLSRPPRCATSAPTSARRREVDIDTEATGRRDEASSCAATSTTSARRATSSTWPTASAATTCCARASPSRPPTARPRRPTVMRRARDLKDAKSGPQARRSPGCSCPR